MKKYTLKKLQSYCVENKLTGDVVKKGKGGFWLNDTYLGYNTHFAMIKLVKITNENNN